MFNPATVGAWHSRAQFSTLCVPTTCRASFWTVYGHLREGGVEALIDCADERSAEVAAFILRAALRAAAPCLGAAASDMFEALQWQEMAEADPEAARRKCYFERARELRRAALAKALVNGGTA